MMKSGLLKTLLAFPTLLMLAGMAHTEWSWRSERTVIAAPFVDPSGKNFVEIRSMPEEVVQPYASGVFVGRRWMPLRVLNAELVFAGSCKHIVATWTSSIALNIVCYEADDTPILVRSSVRGVQIKLALVPERPVDAHSTRIRGDACPLPLARRSPSDC